MKMFKLIFVVLLTTGVYADIPKCDTKRIDRIEAELNFATGYGMFDLAEELGNLALMMNQMPPPIKRTDILRRNKILQKLEDLDYDYMNGVCSITGKDLEKVKKIIKKFKKYNRYINEQISIGNIEY